MDKSFINFRPYPLHTIKFIPEFDMLFICWNSQSFHIHTGRVWSFTTQNTWTGSFRTFIVHGRRTAPDRVQKGPNLAENIVEYVLLTTWDGNSIFSSANRARPSLQKLPLNGFTERNFHRNKENAYQNREYIWGLRR